jgi:catechol 2,3-dioxygenase-like lactoylglutathione lyase family enzyme
MARIQHIAIFSKDTHKVAEFYRTTFELQELSRQDKPNPAIHLSDGNIDLAILPADNDFPEGLNHIGFHVDDVEKTTTQALTVGALHVGATQPRGPVPDGRQAEGYLKDPIGGRVDVSKAGWKT